MKLSDLISASIFPSYQSMRMNASIEFSLSMLKHCFNQKVVNLILCKFGNIVLMLKTSGEPASIKNAIYLSSTTLCS